MIRRPPRSTLFPYTRSSDLQVMIADRQAGRPLKDLTEIIAELCKAMPGGSNFAVLRAADETSRDREALDGELRDRKSTRLNSSHANISYAVFCLKKKKTRRP